MAGVKIADLYAQIGVKVDSSKLQNFLIKLSAVKMRVNQLSAALNNANRSMSNSYGMQAAAERLKAAQERTLAATERRLAATEARARASARAASAGARTPRQTSRARVSMGSGGMGVSGLMSAPASLVASLGGVYALTSSFVNVNKQMGSFEAGMLLTSDSAEAASAKVEWLKSKTNELGINFLSATQDFTQFSATVKAAGGSDKDLRVMFTDIMKIQTSLSMTPDAAEGMTRALGQMVSKGQIMSEELKGQLAERVPGAVAVMAKAIGKTVPELFAMMKNGLPAKEAVASFLEMYSTMAEGSGALAKQQKGLQATINRLSNSWTNFMIAIANAGVLDLLIEGLNLVSDGIKYLIPNVDAVKEGFKLLKQDIIVLIDKIIAWGKVLGVFAIAMGIAAVAVWVMQGGLYALLGTGLSRLIGFFMSLGTSTAFAAGGFWSMLLPVLALGLMLAAFFLIWQDLTSADSWLLNWTEDANGLQRAITRLYDMFTDLYTAVDNLKNLTMPEWFTMLSKAGMLISPMGGAGVLGFNAIASLLPSGGAAASGGTNNSGGNVTVGQIVVSSPEAAVSTTQGFLKQGNPTSLGNTSAH